MDVRDTTMMNNLWVLFFDKWLYFFYTYIFQVLLVAGGSYNNGILSSTEIFELDKSSSWTATTSLPAAIFFQKAVTLNNIVYMTGNICIGL